MNTETDSYIYDLTLAEMKNVVQRWGEPKYRAIQIWHGLYQNLYEHPDEFTNIPRSMRQRLEEEFSFSKLTVQATQQSSDNETLKTLFFLPDHQAIEAVLMRYHKRKTLCISTQAGCAMGCVFCATGQMGFRRNLSSGEIVEQVLYYARMLAMEQEKVTNVVVMGMGEPFHNYENTLGAIETLNQPDGFNLGQRRFTVSTVGLIPMIDKFANEQRQINLAISLHAVDNELRSSMLPINNKYPVEALLDACRNYVSKTHRRITFEWALIYDVNDSPEQARKLGKAIRGLLCHVNVIPLNPTQGYSGKATTHDRAVEFQRILNETGIPCTIRVRRGIDIQAGCGQLAIKSKII